LALPFPYILTSFYNGPNAYRMKGTDASWEHDEEPPVEAIEFSDDEAEAEFRRMRRKQK
jgi:hypothetical protein